MSAFGEYSKYYDLLYADKDYAAECAFVRSVLERHNPGAQNILELGCGSGRHAVEFATGGLSITGIDISQSMLDQARARCEGLHPDIARRIRLQHGDVSTFEAQQRYDAALSLFHVVNYQTTDASLAGVFRAARSALGEGGLFVFDYWYGPAVEAQRPERRERVVEGGDVILTRIAVPEHDHARRLVAVNYTLTVEHPETGHVDEISEVHTLRYLFPEEVDELARASGFEVVESGEWGTGDALSEASWSAYAVLVAISETDG